MTSRIGKEFVRPRTMAVAVAFNRMLPVDGKFFRVLIAKTKGAVVKMKTSVIGRGLHRVEGASKVSGSCIYSADIMRPDALWAGFLRSPFAHARIVKIDASRAQRLPGVKAVITGKNVSPRLEGVTLLDKPVLAQDRVRYIGEKVAAVAA